MYQVAVWLALEWYDFTIFMYSSLYSCIPAMCFQLDLVIVL